MTGADPWADYWAPGGAGGRGGAGSGAGAGCLPQADAAIAPMLDSLWRDFAASLRPKARLLDLATGDGAVLRRIRAARTGLDLTGIDAAPDLPPAPRGIRLRAGVAMEDLPWRAATFDAATSQFGIEYGDTGQIAAELARVLRPGARLRFVLHHAESRVVAHNRERRRALHWASRDSGLVDKARRLAQARAAAALPTPPVFRAAIAEARDRFPDQPVAAEFAAAIVQALSLAPPRAALDRLGLIEARAVGETGRIAALEAAACDAGRIDRLRALFARHAIVFAEPARLEEPGGHPLAWRLDGSRD